ncbi:pyridoxine 5'-phosphate synthase [Neoehrlichia mikurensis]|uniref:Pyridoxine 5'-phosphate synthase n=1 Tax=Neoehrlichia mikurensis TaxID=89586 RepID=A0A9Q9BWK0_9RICK|nr:pyridoxine 5'-phosphate synthase [Neoehrlichia mikurensis]QXK92085.1 pyridoxine 5'-phosphate synthase [Neoehrlichia mikurensis]QXK92542.1 pyridoxine 5'-phosphate synthase [Neoehrlichia mikurensis]QXK93778.1 pyridoxine 5'-phosphate synthase [Neoehrlichia mikurensis]UTO55246.1 pyridoxine 5'-phosphate synthase [Neoehrlichia mikurensis]UTO56167.1 pyridoxine 5'-phosphate synthase [Neoehrlichia mikurensis]
MKDIILGVNVDHVATLRNTRNTTYPDVLEVANLAIKHGADFITIHLREDRRHINDQDVFKLKNNLNAPLNLEIAATDEMLKIAELVHPQSVCLVPENRKEMTTEGGINLKEMYHIIEPMICKLHAINIQVTLFIEPEIEQINYAKKLSVRTIELHTGLYCNNMTSRSLHQIEQAAYYSYTQGIECHAGHGLNYKSAAIIAKIPYISALNIGHFLISESIIHGIGYSVQKMKKVITC